ncbi:HAD family hydrolase [Streptomyces oceani]|uniref:HAD family hydrolase n=1 Tax=Streptomyces oceani TaxID=1075402 RepID=A0A1E7KJS4_9ACTN|nr:HAD family hydrolase [Streptomyces oceani]OEV04252.1 HAD family hydrolase [Streptomyces oceani]
MRHAAVMDVDGTLVDTNYLHTTAWWEAFRQAGHRVPMHAIHASVGLSGQDLIARLLGEERDTRQDAAISAAHKTLYGSYHARLPPLPGARELVCELAGRHWQVVLATSASGRELAALRQAIAADEAIAATASADDVQAGKPAPDTVTRALALVDAAAAGSVFIGDTVWDVRAANNARVPCVAVLSGGVARGKLEEAGAAAVYEDCAELLEHLDESPFT